MTDSLDKKSSEKRVRSLLNHFNADIDAAPLTDIAEEEDAIDRLLIDTGFDQNYETDVSASHTEISLSDEDITPASPMNESEPPFGIDEKTDVKADLTESAEAVSSPFERRSGLAPGLEMNSANGAVNQIPASNPIKPATDIDDLRQFLLIMNLESRTKKAVRLSYAAIGTAFAAIIVAIALAINAYRVQSKISSLLNTASLFQEEKAISLQLNSKTEKNTRTYPRTGVWFVNLISFKDLKDANQRSIEFMKKGVRAEIIKVKVNDEIWYRLRVGEFTSREQANSYAQKIKKPLHLTSIWIANS
ncbi:MAG: SPOR domain-containing protein [Gammaproteobacteria bacterium]